MAFKQHSQQQVHIRIVALAKTSLQIPVCASIILSLRYLSVRSRCCCCCACVMLLKPLGNDYDRLYKIPCSLIISLTFLLNGSDKVLKGEDHSCPIKKKKSNKTDSVCRQKIMQTWKVASVLLIFALFLTELSPHSSSLFGTASEMEVIDAQACIFLRFFTCLFLRFSVLFCAPSEHLSLFVCLFFSPVPHQVYRSQSTSNWAPVLVQTAGERKSPPRPSGNPSSKLKTFPSICWLILESLLCRHWQLSWIKCNAFWYELLPTNDWAKPVYSFKWRVQVRFRDEEPSALLTKLSSSVHSMNYTKERTLYF